VYTRWPFSFDSKTSRPGSDDIMYSWSACGGGGSGNVPLAAAADAGLAPTTADEAFLAGAFFAAGAFAAAFLAGALALAATTFFATIFIDGDGLRLAGAERREEEGGDNAAQA
jgi:hypothetical protein